MSNDLIYSGEQAILRRILKRIVLVVLLLAILGVSGDVLRLNVAERAATPYLYSLIDFEVENFFSKWVHRVASAMPWNSESDEEKRERLDEYFLLGDEIARLQEELLHAGATRDGDSPELAAIETRLASLEAAQASRRNGVEEFLEASISSVVDDVGLSGFLGLIWPPVDFRLGGPPKLLVTSPRDRIERTHDVLLVPGVGIEESEAVEEALLQEQDLSALVVQVGGLATYPASVFNNRPLRWTLQTAAHEWLHHYLAFRPLGWNIFKSGDMQTLNETLADIAGREIGDRVFERLGGEIPAESASIGLPLESPDGLGQGSFDFDREMRALRLRVDELLADGKIEEAEALMEERRQVLVANGFPIRKLNQAYFAFHGTYAESPTSVSPIAGQLRALKETIPDLGDFIKTVAGASSYDRFLEILDTHIGGSASSRPTPRGLAAPRFVGAGGLTSLIHRR